MMRSGLWRLTSRSFASKPRFPHVGLKRKGNSDQDFLEKPSLTPQSVDSKPAPEDLSSSIGLELAEEIRASANLPRVFGKSFEKPSPKEPEKNWRYHLSRIFPTLKATPKNYVIAFFGVLSIALYLRLDRGQVENGSVVAVRGKIISDLKEEINAHKEHQSQIFALSQEYVSSLPAGSSAQKSALSFYQQILNFSTGQPIVAHKDVEQKTGGKFVGLV